MAFQFFLDKVSSFYGPSIMENRFSCGGRCLETDAMIARPGIALLQKHIFSVFRCLLPFGQRSFFIIPTLMLVIYHSVRSFSSCVFWSSCNILSEPQMEKP